MFLRWDQVESPDQLTCLISITFLKMFNFYSVYQYIYCYIILITNFSDNTTYVFFPIALSHTIVSVVSFEDFFSMSLNYRMSHFNNNICFLHTVYIYNGSQNVSQ